MKTKQTDIILRNTIQNHNIKGHSIQNHSLKDTAFPGSESVQAAEQQTTEKIRFFNDPLELLGYLNLSPEQVGFSAQASHLFPFKVPFSYVQNIEPGKPNDPLLRQILPVNDELQKDSRFTCDPLEEHNNVCQPGMLKKYSGRVLLLTTPGCAINCRYCFRRHYPYADKGHIWSQISKNLDLIAQDPSISEVILSGGDPLSLGDQKLALLLSKLETIPQLKRIRIHTRYPVAAPDRITPGLLRLIRDSTLKMVLVLHINHSHELGTPAQKAVSALGQTGIRLYNQSVLLKGVNDSLEVLTHLSETLFDLGIQPYYLHLLDKISGTVHFDLDEQQALQLYRQLRGTLPGYMVPNLVREIPGEKNKIPFV